MTSPDPLDAAQVNWAQYDPSLGNGHYESFYQRANHPAEPWAFWIRYTVFSPESRPEAAIGELWAVFFDGTTGEHVVAKEEYPIAECGFDRTGFGVRIKDRVLGPGVLRGAAGEISWDLTFDGAQPPLYLLPRPMYAPEAPGAKSLVALPLASYRGRLTVGERQFGLYDWVGSQNHNWGPKHARHYAFGQVAGFDNAPDSFLEAVTTQLKPDTYVTLLVLRHAGREHTLSAPAVAAAFGAFFWDFTAENDDVQIAGHLESAPGSFVTLRYFNPPGGVKHCLNTKIGTCELVVTDKRTGRQETLRTEHRALFEILADDPVPGVAVRA